MWMCAYPFLPSIVIISLQTFFQFNFFCNDMDASETCKTSDFTGYEHFFCIEEKKKKQWEDV